MIMTLGAGSVSQLGPQILAELEAEAVASCPRDRATSSDSIALRT